GVIHIDATQAPAGQVAHLTITATDPSTNTTATQTVTVNVVANNDAQGQPITERPFLATQIPNQVVGQVDSSGTIQQDVFQIPAVAPTPGDQLTYQVGSGTTTDSAHGGQTIINTTIANATATVDQATGIVTVTPTAGFTGVINLIVGVRDQVPRSNEPPTG